MHRFVVLLVGLAGLVKTETDMGECIEILKLGERCCDFIDNEKEEAIIKECETSASYDPDSCEIETCYGKKAGFILSNGTLDKTLLIQMIDSRYENYTDILTVVKEECMLDDVEDTCDVRRIGICLSVQELMNCPVWKSYDECSNVKEKIQICEKIGN